MSSSVLATALARKASGHVDGFVIEGPTAGGHNAPPRGPLHCNDRGEPIYGPRDRPDLEVFRSLGRPFWLAGSYDSPERVAEAIAAGAAGVQVGTAFAFCEESGLDGYRIYLASDIERLQQALILRQLGYSLAEVRQHLAESEFAIAQLIPRYVECLREQMRLQQALRERLEGMTARLESKGTFTIEDTLKTIKMMIALEACGPVKPVE